MVDVPTISGEILWMLWRRKRLQKRYGQGIKVIDEAFGRSYSSIEAVTKM